VECYGDVTFTYTWEDCAGEEYTWDFVFTVLAPVVEIPANGAETVACPSLVIAPAAPVLFDNCGRELEFIGVSDPDIVECYGDVTFTYTWEDCAGEEYTWDFVFTVLAPVVEIPANGAETVACPSLVIAPAAPVLYDNCGRELEFIGVSDPDIVECYGDVTFTYTWEDCAGEEYTWDFVFTVLAPVVEIPADSGEMVECYDDVYMPAAPQLFDNCGRELMVSAPVITEDFDGCEGTVIYTFTYTDCAGVEYDWSYTFHILDTTDPVFTYVPADITLECDDPLLECIFPQPETKVVSMASAKNNCGGHSIVLGGAVYADGYTTFTYIVTSGSSPALSHWILAFCGDLADVDAGPGTIELGNDPTTGVYGIKFDTGLDSGETMEFYITLPGMWDTGMIEAAVKAGTTECYYMVEGPVCDDVPPPPPPCPDMPVAVDNCTDDVTITYVDEMIPGDCENEYVVIRTFTATDDCGNTATATQTITVVDTTAPVFTFVPEDVSVACLDDVVLEMATAEDNCGEAVVTYNDVITDEICVDVYTIIRTFTATDDCGNEETAVQVITILPPVVEIPEDGGAIVACPSEVIAPEAPVLYDNCGRELEFIGVSEPDIIECYGDVTFTYTWEDCAGVEYTWNFVFTVEEPVVVIPPNSGETVACPSEVIAPAAPVLYDNCERPLTFIGVTEPMIPECAGEVIFTYTWEDCAGVEYTWNYVFTIEDPVVEIPEDGAATVACPSEVIAPAAPVLYDNCERPLTFIGVTEPMIPECAGEVTFTYTWEDCLGVEYTWNYVFTIEDPVVEIPADGGETVACPSEVMAPAAPVLYDNCERPLTFIGVTEPMIPECAGEVIFTYTWEDCAGVEYTWNYVFTIEDPVVEIPADGGETVACPSEVIAPAAPVLYDNCERPLTFIGVTEPMIPECAGEVIFTYTWEDCAGVEYTWNYVFTIEDPVVEIPADGGETVACPSEVMAPAAPVLYDNCERPLTFIGVTEPMIPECAGEVIFTYTWEDCAGVEYTWNYVFTIEDPVVEIPADGGETVACPSEVMAPAAPVLYDNCERPLTFIGVTEPMIPECAGEVIFTYTWEDCAGVEYTWNYVFTIEDPVVEIPADGMDNVECYDDIYIPVVPQLFDNCGRELMVSGPVVTEVFDGCEGTVTYTFTFTDCAEVDYDWNFVIHIKDITAPVLISVLEDLVFECGEEVVIEMPMYEDNCTEFVEVFCGIVGLEGVSCEDYEFPEGETQIYFYGVDECGNESEKTYITVTVEPCIFCTLTQGGYGNAGGTYCDMGTIELLNALLMANNGLTVGYGNRTFTVPATGAQCVINILPGGGAPAALPVGHWGCDNLGNLVHPRTGRLTNNLLSQTIVFQLNIYWSPSMMNYKFTNRSFYTASSSVCPDEFNPQPVGTWTMYTFSEAVWNLLTADDGKLSIAELLDLANRALGGENVGIPVSAVYEAIDMLNNAFHECTFVSNNPPASMEEPADEQKLFKVESSISVNVAPNPFRNHAQISFSVEYDTNVVVEVYTLQGTKVAVLFEEAVKAHEINSVTFNVEGQTSRQMYLVVVRTPYGRASMQIVNAR
jgi:hypothetical protein